jgi:hypothetical protein
MLVMNTCKKQLTTQSLTCVPYKQLLLSVRQLLSCISHTQRSQPQPLTLNPAKQRIITLRNLRLSNQLLQLQLLLLRRILTLLLLRC